MTRPLPYLRIAAVSALVVLTATALCVVWAVYGFAPVAYLLAGSAFLVACVGTYRQAAETERRRAALYAEMQRRRDEQAKNIANARELRRLKGDNAA